MTACSECGSTDLIGPFIMDGIIGGTFTVAHRWTVCRACGKGDARGRPDISEVPVTLRARFEREGQ